MRSPTVGYDAKNAALIGGSALAGVLATIVVAGLGLRSGSSLEVPAHGDRVVVMSSGETWRYVSTEVFSRAQREAMAAQRDKMAAQRDKMAAQRERLAAQRDKLAAQRDRMAVQREAMAAQRDKLAVQREAMAARREAVAARRYEMVERKSASEQLFGTVRLAAGRDGEVSLRHGFLRWDRNEGGWGDPLNAVKADGGSQSSVRFGHVARIERLGDQALVTLRSGETVRFRNTRTDVGPSLRRLVVTDVDGGRTELGWREIEQVSFDPAPAGAVPPAGRLHGTLQTVSGMEFTGFVAWDIDEILTSDVLDGEFQGRSYEVPFGAVASIAREGLESVRATLHSGEELLLSGSNDVNRRNNGITVSDPGLGAVNVSWEDFALLRFHAPAVEMTVHDFDGGRPLVGTVTTASGGTVSGRIRWDADEAWSWETLDGWAGETEFEIEFSKIAGIAKVGDGAAVTLRDGRVFHLERSNDVGRGNRGVVVSTEVDGVNLSVKVAWKEFLELLLEG